MTAQDIAEFVRQYVPTFVDVEILPPGTAYHYTHHARAIATLGRFLGALLSADLDHTQDQLVSRPATSDPGVVFAYADLGATAEEGFGAEIMEISYIAAVRATHRQEASLGAPPCILIASCQITEFSHLGKADALVP